ncbi:hypothetical protein TIFTF001_002842 [Ficus carica]|uniref:Uncharacterized protein n=1 Tax=Ficus carica TaxID=3494 RepID=A0AA87Z6L9_FICCA|nr:hypothetical protein TIFTF001_002842 [Ficus carica]
MAGQKRRKPCKNQSSEKLCTEENQSTNPHTGNSLKVLNERRTSLRKKLKPGEESSETEHGKINAVQDLLKAVPPCKQRSFQKYATPPQEVTNSSTHVPSRSYRGTILRDDSPEVETNAAPQISLGKRNASVGYPTANKTRSHRTSSEVGIFPEVSVSSQRNLGSHASTKARASIKSTAQACASLIRERNVPAADLTWESLLLRSLKERCPEDEEPRAEDNLMLHLRSLRDQYPEGHEENEPIAEDNLSLLLQSLREQYPENDEPMEHCQEDNEPIEQHPEPMERSPDSKAGTSRAPPSRDAVWTKAHLKKNGELIKAVAGETNGNTEEQQKTPLSSTMNVRKDVLSIVLGPDTIDRSRASKRLENDDRIARLEGECRELKEKMAYMQCLLETLLKDQASNRCIYIFLAYFSSFLIIRTFRVYRIYLP